jgi:uncharacterized protein (TIGR02001 family)
MLLKLLIFNNCIKMIKKLTLSTIASLLLLSQASNSQTKVGTIGEITGTIGAATHYVSKGFESNRDKPTANLTGEFASSSNIQVILGAGIFAAKPDKPVTAGTGYDYEMNYYGGLRKAIDKATLEAGYIYVHFPSASKGDELALNTGAYYGKASFQATKDTSFRVYYEQDDTGGAVVGDEKRKVIQNYIEVGFSHNLGPATLNASYGDYKKAAKHYKVGLSKEIMGFNVSADYIDNDKTKATVTDKHDNQLVVVSVSKSF